MLVVRAIEDVSHPCFPSMHAPEIRKQQEKMPGNDQMKMVEKVNVQNQLASCLESQNGKSR
jgi:hypothetical protein